MRVVDPVPVVHPNPGKPRSSCVIMCHYGSTTTQFFSFHSVQATVNQNYDNSIFCQHLLRGYKICSLRVTIILFTFTIDLFTPIVCSGQLCSWRLLGKTGSFTFIHISQVKMDSGIRIFQVHCIYIGLHGQDEVKQVWFRGGYFFNMPGLKIDMYTRI